MTRAEKRAIKNQIRNAIKEGSIPSIMEEYLEMVSMGEMEEKILEKEEIYRRKPNLKQKLQIRWVNGLEYRKNPIHVLELKTERNGKLYKRFSWLMYKGKSTISQRRARNSFNHNNSRQERNCAITGDTHKIYFTPNILRITNSAGYMDTAIQRIRKNLAP